MILKYLGILFFFIGMSALAYEYIPRLLRRHAEMQNRRMEKAAKQLEDQMIAMEERRRIMLAFTMTPLMLGSLAFVFFHNLVVAVVGFCLGLIVPTILVKNIPIRRRQKFQLQFVDGVRLITSSLKAGLNFIQALEIVAEELPAPLGDEFGLVVRENKMGMTLTDCLEHLKQRMPLEDLYMVITAVNIAQETGGDLTEVFDELVVTIIEKKKLEDRVRVLTVQGKLQGIIMGILPVAFGMFVYTSNPHNFDIMLTNKVGQMLIVYCIASELIGVFLIKKLSKVEV